MPSSDGTKTKYLTWGWENFHGVTAYLPHQIFAILFQSSCMLLCGIRKYYIVDENPTLEFHQIFQTCVHEPLTNFWIVCGAKRQSIKFIVSRWEREPC